MELDRDFSEFIASCAANDVRFLIVGGYAVAAYGHPRFTKDLGVWVWVDERNADRLVSALEDFGFGALGLTRADFLEEDTVVQLGYPPKRIDILTQVDGVEFDACWERRVEIEVVGMRVPFISADDLLANKRPPVVPKIWPTLPHSRNSAIHSAWHRFAPRLPRSTRWDDTHRRIAT
jgi:hypothetical protein